MKELIRPNGFKHVGHKASLAAIATMTAVLLMSGFFAGKVRAASSTVCDSGCDYTTVQSAIDAASAGDTISLQGDVNIEAQININKSITLDGSGHTLFASFAKTDNSNNSAIGISHDNVAIKNLTEDGTAGTNLHGINVYESAGVVLENVTVSHNGHAGLNVNGSTVTATNLNTDNNAWGAVNVDPGVGVTSPSVFNLISGTLAESTQIWSDGSNVNNVATVSVSVPAGYTEYHDASSSYIFWQNKLGNVATITRDGVNYLYSSIQSAINSASAGETISINGIFGSSTAFTSYEVATSGITIKGVSGNKIYGTFNLRADGITLDSLNIYSRGGGNDSLKNAVNVISKSVNITNCTFEMPNPDAVAAGGGVGNGIVIWPYGDAAANLNITGNTFTGYGATVTNWASTALLIAEEIDMSRVGMGGTSSTTITVVNESSLATNNVFTGSYYDYVHSNWNGYKVLYSSVSNASALTDVVEDSTAGATILLGGNITNGAQLNLAKAVTVDGANHTLTTTSTSGSVIEITADNVTLKNLVEDGNGTAANNRGINVYKATGVLLDHVTVSNNKKNGIVVNGSIVTVNYITTKNNGWGGIDVDMGSGVSTQASLTVNGVSAHAETGDAIRIDDTSKTPTPLVVDTNNQYTTTVTGNTVEYALSGKISSSNPQVAVISATEPVTVTVDTGAVNPTVDVHTLVTAGSGTLPEITITSNKANISIPASTVVTSSDVNWDGIINAPTVTSAPDITPTGGNNAITSTYAIEVGDGDNALTFDQPVKVTLPGQAGKFVGWSRAGVFTQITDTCDSLTTPTLAPGAECRIDDGSDLIVWTKHFSTFVAYTQAVTGGGGGGGGAPASTPTPTPTPATPVPTPTPPQGEVLGATAHGNGALVNINGTVYVISNGQRRAFRSAEEFRSYGYSFTQVEQATEADIALPEGSIMTIIDGSLVLDTSDGRTIYFIGAGGVKRGFVSAAVFQALGYKFSQAVRFNLSGYAVGTPIASTSEAHPDGALVFDGKTVWWVNYGKRHGFPTQAIFNSYGLKFANMVTANAADLALPEGGVVVDLPHGVASGSFFAQ